LKILSLLFEFVYNIDSK